MCDSSSSLFSVSRFSRKHEDFSDSSLRHLIFNAEDRYAADGSLIKGNGMKESGALVRVGRKVLISEPEFLEWIKSGRAAR